MQELTFYDRSKAHTPFRHVHAPVGVRGAAAALDRRLPTFDVRCTAVVDKADHSRNMAMEPQHQEGDVERTTRVREVAAKVSQLARDVDRPNEV